MQASDAQVACILAMSDPVTREAWLARAVTASAMEGVLASD